jgi:hypothetical protein
MIFECHYEAVSDRPLCKFHHKDYSRENPKDVIDSFYNLADYSIKSNQPLFCIGFNFTEEVTLSSMTFPKKVYFTHAYFRERTTFNKMAFLEDTSFFNTTFLKETVFNKTSFYGLAYFSDAVFVDEAVFNKVTFKKLANFPNARFKGEAIMHSTMIIVFLLLMLLNTVYF